MVGASGMADEPLKYSDFEQQAKGPAPDERPPVIVFRCTKCKRTMALRLVSLCVFCDGEMEPLEKKD